MMDYVTKAYHRLILPLLLGFIIAGAVVADDPSTDQGLTVAVKTPQFSPVDLLDQLHDSVNSGKMLQEGREASLQSAREAVERDTCQSKIEKRICDN